MSSDAILLQGAQVPAALGVTAAERRMGRPVQVDLEVGVDLREAGRSDRLASTIDYQALYDVVAEVASGREHKLVEALGENIVAALFERFAIDWVTIEVRKAKPVSGVIESAGIRITRTRAGEDTRGPRSGAGGAPARGRR
ncbi:MAG: dihydroneopterin aldolase [Deltaproteobacteria bacterium]|nr:dihydroneopterin aldolase [Deltaproteobacteria bacterium]